VLLVEDDPGYALLVRSMIDETPLGELGFEHTGLVSDACDYLLQVGVGCVLLDLSLPDARRLQGVERLRAADPDTPIVVLTNLEDDVVAADAVASGAQDYLIKGRTDGYQLAHAVRYAIQRKRRERAQALELPNDPLTGLPSGPLLADRLQVAISRTQSAGSWLALLSLEFHDLDEIERRYGRNTATRLVTEFATRLAAVRPHDSVARDGGRYFVLIEDFETTPDEVALADELLADLREAGVETDGADLSPRLRVGVAVGSGRVSPGAMIERAVASIGHRAGAPASPIGPMPTTQLEALRVEIDSAIDYGLALEEIEALLHENPVPDEIRDAAWLYAWSVLQQRAEGHGPGGGSGAAGH